MKLVMDDIEPFNFKTIRIFANQEYQKSYFHLELNIKLWQLISFNKIKIIEVIDNHGRLGHSVLCDPGRTSFIWIIFCCPSLI